MNRSPHPWWSLLAALLSAACGGGGLAIDGGPVGTGITASVAGNVVAVEDPSPLGAPAAVESEAPSETTSPQSVEGVEVGIVELPELTTTTDAEGNFRLEGEFSGPVTLRFRATPLEVVQRLDVPAGGVVVLADIQLELDGLTAEAGRQLAADGRVRQIDCSAGRLVLEDRSGEIVEARLLDETAFVRDGAAAACDEIQTGDDLSVEGFLDDLGARDVTALIVTIAPDRQGPPPLERRVGFLGHVVAIDCGAGGLAVDDGQHRVRARIGPETTIRAAGGAELSCADLSLGDRVTGSGLLDLRRPGLVRARALIRSGHAGPGAPLPIAGAVVAVDCEEDIVVVALEGTVVSVRLLAETRTEPAGVSCEDLVPGAIWVRGDGFVSDTVPGALDARRLRFKKIRDGLHDGRS